MNKRGLYTLETALKMTRNETRQNYRRHINPIFVQVLTLIDFDKEFIRAEGAHVWDAEGNCYLDFLGAYGALNLGHNHPAIMNALQKVSAYPKLLPTSINRLASALAHNLACVTPGELSRCFFGNSGAEAVEGALKLARAATKKNKIVYCENSFHGKTLGALSVTGRAKYRQPFQPLIPGCQAIPFGDIQALEKALSGKDVAAFILEPIQGEGGIIVPPEGYLKEVRRLCTSYGTLLIIDEIQTGLGRTGRMFACEWEEVEPDVLCLAKSLGGGIMPIGAFITKDKLWDKAYGSLDTYLNHTSTFGSPGENTLAVAAGLATLNVLLEQDIPAQVIKKTESFWCGLNGLKQKYRLIREIRGRGLLVGIEFEKPHGLLDKLSGGRLQKLSQEYLASMIAGELMNKHHIITAYTLNNPNVIRLEPPLTIEESDLERVVGALEKILSDNRSFGSIALTGGRTALESLFKK